MKGSGLRRGSEAARGPGGIQRNEEKPVSPTRTRVGEKEKNSLKRDPPLRQDRGSERCPSRPYHTSLHALRAPPRHLRPPLPEPLPAAPGAPADSVCPLRRGSGGGVGASRAGPGRGCASGSPPGPTGPGSRERGRGGRRKWGRGGGHSRPRLAGRWAAVLGSATAPTSRAGKKLPARILPPRTQADSAVLHPRRRRPRAPRRAPLHLRRPRRAAGPRAGSAHAHLLLSHSRQRPCTLTRCALRGTCRAYVCIQEGARREGGWGGTHQSGHRLQATQFGRCTEFSRQPWTLNSPRCS